LSIVLRMYESDRNPLIIYNPIGEPIANYIMCYKLKHEKNRLTHW